ncbi:MAG: hypothetical protein QXN71_00890 [Candidatus Aenigmatarchaeota archaeon]
MKQFLAEDVEKTNRFIIFTLSAFFACAFFTTLVANGAELEYYGVESTINENMTVSTVVNIRFLRPVKSFDYTLNYRIYGLDVTANFGTPDCRLFESEQASKIVCSLEGMTEKNNLLTLRFQTGEKITSFNNKYNFSTDYSINLPSREAFILIKIPKNSVLSEEPANQSYTPSDGKILSDGKHIMVYWQMENLTETDELKFSVSYMIPSTGAFYNNILVVLVAGMIIISMVSVAVYIRKGSGKPEIEILSSVLNADEKKVVDILARHGGKSGQKVIVRESDFSKAKVSRLVKSMKERGIVEIEPISGRENRIILKLERREEPSKEKEPSPETAKQ